MSYITTVTGKHFDPVNPDEKLIDIYDIAHSLSLICRANGHIKHFYSVAQHSVACAKEAQKRDAERDRQMQAIGLTVIRVKDGDVRRNPESVTKSIMEIVLEKGLIL